MPQELRSQSNINANILFPAVEMPSAGTNDSARLDRRAGVCGGVMCIRETRVPVWVLERCRQLQMAIPQILEDYPFLEAADVDAAWKYADAHREEIAHQIQENGDC